VKKEKKSKFRTPSFLRKRKEKKEAAASSKDKGDKWTRLTSLSCFLLYLLVLLLSCCFFFFFFFFCREILSRYSFVYNTHTSLWLIVYLFCACRLSLIDCYRCVYDFVHRWIVGWTKTRTRRERKWDTNSRNEHCFIHSSASHQCHYLTEFRKKKKRHWRVTFLYTCAS
jgi:hypothetical protein